MSKISKVSQGVKISVKTEYSEEYSIPKKSSHVFIYYIEIENLTDRKIKLLKRRWEIFDFNSGKRIVEGEGVVGVKPVFQPGDVYSYNSACELLSQSGRMKGKYLFKDLDTNEEFWVDIPEFEMYVPVLMN
jgi:ApaG protein